MRGVSKFLTLAALTAAFILPVSTAAAATTTVDYDIVGTASATLFPAASLAGAAVSVPTTEVGVWTAVMQNDLGGITGGTFTFRSKVRTFTDTDVTGTFGPATVSTCAKTTIPVRGELDGGGVLNVTLTRYGFTKAGSCVVYLSTVRGTARIVFLS